MTKGSLAFIAENNAPAWLRDVAGSMSFTVLCRGEPVIVLCAENRMHKVLTAKGVLFVYDDHVTTTKP